jgi:hypothetical protein
LFLQCCGFFVATIKYMGTLHTILTGFKTLNKVLLLCGLQATRVAPQGKKHAAIGSRNNGGIIAENLIFGRKALIPYSMKIQ